VPKNKIPVNIPVPNEVEQSIVEDFKNSLLKVLRKGVYTENPKYMRPKEACLYLGVSHRTVYNWMNNGTIQSKRVGGSRLISRDSLNKLVS
jgi:excisionase family DNA binding protein